MNAFGPCSKENGYGYQRGQPCIFLSLEKRDDWKPDFYNNVNDLPEQMPSHTIGFIKSSSYANNRTLVGLLVSMHDERKTSFTCLILVEQCFGVMRRREPC